VVRSRELAKDCLLIGKAGGEVLELAKDRVQRRILER
jgi:hypothetical protein